MAKKRKIKHKKSALESFAREFTSEHENVELRLNPKGEISMSDAISKLIEPYIDDAPDYSSFRNLVSFACIAWNAANLPAKEQDGLINKMLGVARGRAGDRLQLLGLLTELIDRKKRMLPNVSRMIVDFKVTEQGDDFHIAIAATLEKQNAKK